MVEEVDKAGCKGWLEGVTLLLATDNDVVKSCLCKGNSTSPTLYGLVLRLKNVEMKYSCRLLVTHVAETRMVEQETDGVSRGSLRNGVAVGLEMIKYCTWG